MVACPPILPRILIVADGDPPPPPQAASLSHLLARPDYRFTIASMLDAPEKIEQQELSAAVLLRYTYFNGHQKDLIRVLDGLVERHISTIVLACSQSDLELAESDLHLRRADGCAHELQPG